MAKAENPLDELVDYGVDQLLVEAVGLPDDIPPFGSRKLSQEEQLQRYEEMRDSPTVWRKLLDEHGLRQTVEYAGRMEGRGGQPPGQR